jgi:D-mannonate dehydratase
MPWYGSADPVSLADIKQAGSTNIVTALHHISNGEVWAIVEINGRKEVIENASKHQQLKEFRPAHSLVLLSLVEVIRLKGSSFQNLLLFSCSRLLAIKD